MASIEWTETLASGVVLRVRLATDRQGNVVWFTIQLEIMGDRAGAWMPVVRYDSAHGEAHIDYLDPNGDEYHKHWLGAAAPYNQVFNAALASIKVTYRAHLERWRRQKGGLT